MVTFLEKLVLRLLIDLLVYSSDKKKKNNLAKIQLTPGAHKRFRYLFVEGNDHDIKGKVRRVDYRVDRMIKTTLSN